MLLIRAITHGASQPHNPDPLKHLNPIFNGDAALRRFFVIHPVMISTDIKNRAVGKSCQKREILRMQIATGNNTVDIF